MNVEIKSDTKAVQRALQRLGERIHREVDRAILATAGKGSNIIQDRMDIGLGISGKFVKYSPGYAKRKKSGWPATKAGSKYYTPAFGGDASGIVNLTVTGRMRASMQTSGFGSGKARIYFSKPEEAKKAAFNSVKRPFMGFNKQNSNVLARFFFDRILKAAKR